MVFFHLAFYNEKQRKNFIRIHVVMRNEVFYETEFRHYF